MKNSYLLILMLLCGCAPAPVQEPVALGHDGAACVGRIPSTVQGLAAAANEQLSTAARGLNNKGGVCAAAVFTATAPVQVYRVYDAKTGNPYGRWWSLTPPAGTREQYRSAYAICPEWGALDRLISCRLKPGSQIVLGTTQSIQCTDMAYPQSADIQVYIPNDSRTQAVYVDNCTEQAAWSGAQTPPLVVNSREPADNSAGALTGSNP